MEVRRVFFFSSRRRHTRYWRDWSSDVCSSDLVVAQPLVFPQGEGGALGSRQREQRAQHLAALLASLDFLTGLAAVEGRHLQRSEERRVGKECRSRWSPYH